LDEKAKAIREETEYPPEIYDYRLTALTGWTAEERGRCSQRVLNDLFLIDEEARVADRVLLAKTIASELARIIVPLMGGTIR
jgi:hypothetical protein